MIEAVTFDFWNTLVWESRGYLKGRRLEVWAGLLEEAGFTTERAELEAVFDRTWEAYVASWRANQQFQAAQAAAHAIEALGFKVPQSVRLLLVDAFAQAIHGAELHPTPNLFECLKTLRDNQVRLGIICDVGFTPSHILRAHLQGRRLLEMFDHCSFSDEVGAYKPSPMIFNHALTGLNVAPEVTAHVGDLRLTDVAGALAMGMVSVRYTGVHDDDSQAEPEAHHVISDHAKLPGALGVG